MYKVKGGRGSMKKDYFTKDETEMIENDAKKMVKWFVRLLLLVIMYVLTGWKLWLALSAFPIAFFVQMILGLYLLRKVKQKEKRENDELDF